MDTLSNDDILEQYYNNDNPSSANYLKYPAFRVGGVVGNENDELYDVGKRGNDIIVVGEDDDSKQGWEWSESF